MFLGKYFPPFMVTKIRNEITNFHQRPDESLFEALKCYKLSIDRCPNHNMFLFTQIDTFYNGLTLRHRDTINAAAGRTFMKRRPEVCYDLIKNMTAHHNDWDTSAQRSELSSSITSSSNQEIIALKAEMAKINKNIMKVLQINQQVKAVTPSCKICGGPHAYNDCSATVGQTQNVYAAGAYQSVERETEVTKDTVPPTNNKRTKDVQPPVVQIETPVLNSEPFVAPIIEPIVAPISASKPNQKPSIPYPSRLHDQKLRNKTNDQKEKFFKIFQDFNFNITFTVVLILMPKFGLPIKNFFTNKDKFFELARTPLIKHCSAVLLKKLPEKLGDPVVEFDADPRVPLILERSFLKIEKALIDVFEGELTLRVGKEAITFNLDQTSRYSANYNDLTANRIDVIDMACEEYSQEVHGFSDVIVSGNHTPYYDSIVSTSSPTLTPFGDSGFLLEEGDAFYLLMMMQLHWNQGNYLPQDRKELKICKAKNDKSSIDEPREVELKDLPLHLEYAFLEGKNKLPVIIAKDLSVEEKSALIKVLKSHKQSLGKPRTFCTEKRGFIVVENEENELIPTRMVTGQRVCIDYRKLNEATRKDHIPLPFMDQMLKRLAGNEYYCFLDGFSDTNLCLNWEKSQFIVKEGIVLGHKISKNRIEFDKAKVDVIAKLPHPTTVKDIPFFFSNECIEAFQTLKRTLIKAPILIAPDWDLPFELMCYASDFSIGVVMGKHQENHFRPIHYASKTMTKAKSNYTMTKKEMLAVVYAFDKFRSYPS
nr:hypothetical protein [Tanacetum cinerariifolium]